MNKPESEIVAMNAASQRQVKSQGFACPLVFGIILIIISITILIRNEGRSVTTTRSLNEGLRKVYEGDFSIGNSQHIGQLVHISGELNQPETLVDDYFGVIGTGIRLERIVEMYQWQEHRHDSRHVDENGKEVVDTIYNYKKGWFENPVLSDRFNDPSYMNPDEFQWSVKSLIIEAPSVYLKGFRLSQNLLSQVTRKELLHLSTLKVDLMRQSLSLSSIKNNTILIDSDKWYIRGNSFSTSLDNPKVGTMRVSYKTTPIDIVSVIAKEDNRNLISYTTDAGDALEILSYGNLSAKEMFQAQHEGNTKFTWFLRVFGILLMFIGFHLLLSPINVIGNALESIPFLGGLISSLVSLGVFIVAIALSTSTAMIVICLSWIFYRPFYMTVLLVLATLPMIRIFNPSKATKEYHKLHRIE